VKPTTQDPYVVSRCGSSELKTTTDRPSKTFCVRAVIRKLCDTFLCVEATSAEEAAAVARTSAPEEFDTWQEQPEGIEVYDVREVAQEETRDLNLTDGGLEP
jgi:hypothetical protein